MCRNVDVYHPAIKVAPQAFRAMNTLSPTLRKQLERTVADARDVAESGSRAALEALAVLHRDPYGHMGAEQRALRRRLRAHARQLGDRRDARSGNQAIDRLVHECAYEHWHGMLFARFLSENRLLIEPGLGVAVTLEECEELAKDEGIDKWALAARFAQGMLPQVFRPDHPVFEVRLAREHRLNLEGLVENLPAEVFTATDSLGWVYQFWQSRKKAEVNRSEVKIGADELPAVTQLFTEPYMVSFLLDNSLGAWWVSRFPSRPRPINLPYLRTAGEGPLMAGGFEGWPDDLKEFRLLDPCCGSGHFLVAAFLMLVPMRMALENISAAEATDAVLRENLHGLELDRRCVAIAAFALGLEAWRFPNAGGYRPLPKLNIAWCGQPVHEEREQWIALARGDIRFEAGMSALYEAFHDAPILGSLIDPSRSVSEDMFTAGFDELESMLDQTLSNLTYNEDSTERTVVARDFAVAARLLTGRYHAVITNVPYLGREKHAARLRRFLEDFYPLSKYDLATAFVERIAKLCAPDGDAFLVLPQYWLFLSRYEKLRKHLLENCQWRFVVSLGARAFETISGEVVNTCLAAFRPLRENSTDGFLAWLDVSECRTIEAKDSALRNLQPDSFLQDDQLTNPNTIIGYSSDRDCGLLEDIAYSYQGLATSDNSQFVFNFWEIPRVSRRWGFFQFAPDVTKRVSGCSHVLYWEDGKGKYADHASNLKAEGRLGGWKSGHAAWGKRGIAINRMGKLPASLYFGTKFDCNVAVIVPHDEREIPAIWKYCSSPEYFKEVRKLNSKLSVTNSTLTKVPFRRAIWSEATAGQSVRDLYQISTSDPSQWTFHGHPAHASNALQVAISRLLGYRWPIEDDPVTDWFGSACTRAYHASELNTFEDSDGIVCIPSVRGEKPAHDRLFELLVAAHGDAWNEGILAALLAEAGSSTLDDWLRNRFFEQHCVLFHHRPFIWHVWDGRKHDGFHALVNYHKLAERGGNGGRLLESLTYSYLGDWISRQHDGVNRGVDGAEDRLTAALELQKRLAFILDGEVPFDIFVRWKPIEEQPIGWEPDVNDGVRINIRPFMIDDIPGGKKDAGVLRSKPNIHWRNDRGKEPLRDQARFPWFWKDGEFVRERINSIHLTKSEKRNGRIVAKDKPIASLG